MKARPILMSAPMIGALLAGTKTQTRRTVKPHPSPSSDTAFRGEDGIWRFSHPTIRGPVSHEADDVRCPYGGAEDFLWCRESWAYRLDHDHLNGTQLYEAGVRSAWYWADGPGKCCNTGCDGAAGRVRAARFMPRWASRLTLRITEVRVQRLQEISEADAIAEGITGPHDVGYPAYLMPGDSKPRYSRAAAAYEDLWGSINGADSWATDPWVWRLEFQCIQANVDEVLANGR